MRIAFLIISLFTLFSCNNTIKTKNKKATGLNIKSRDSIIFNSFIEYSKVCPINKISSNATFFLNTPYKGGTLDINKKEKLVINLRELDCLTFVENVLALYICRKDSSLNLQNFIPTIKRIRYRNGNLKGYASRLHYSTDWLFNNSEKGIIKDITKQTGGTPFNVSVNFMSNHSDKYKSLKTKKSVNRIKEIENNINSRKYYYIYKTRIKDIERNIENGDIIFITTNINGLDIAHVGYAINVNNRIHLLHASSQLNKVVISENPLHEYLSDIKHFTGIMIARIN
jgi:hypothetical protein